MQRISLSLNDEIIEEKLADLAKSLNKKPADIIIEALKKFLAGTDKEQSHLTFSRLDVIEHSHILNPSDSEVAIMENIKLFGQATDTAKFARQLREESWK